jgi:F-type H+-transporting ATPase subunit gamma
MQQITKAMNLVAAAKLNRVKAKVLAARPFYQGTRNAVGRLLQAEGANEHLMFQERTGDNVLVVLMTSDRGLCGAYNSLICKEAMTLLNKHESGDLIVVGTKGRDYFTRRRRKVLSTAVGISEEPYYEDALPIGQELMQLYDSGEYDKVYLVYTYFASTISHEPTVVQLLPVNPAELIDTTKTDNSGEKTADGFESNFMLYEPGVESILNYMLPKYVNAMIFGALQEAAACQQAARMTSMDTATENAEKMIGTLTLRYNRARQAAITQEINEIVGGADAIS